MISIYKTIAELNEKAKSAVLCTVIKTSGSAPRHATSKMLVYPDGSIEGTVGGGGLEQKVISDALVYLNFKKSVIIEYHLSDPSLGDVGVCGGQVMVFIDPILPPPEIIIIGGGHVGKAVAHLAKWLGYKVVISDDRKEFCSQEINPDADVFIHSPMKDLPSQYPIDNQSCLVLTTRGVSVDIEGLPSLLKTKAQFIGVIGSKKRWQETKKGLLIQGIPTEVLATIHSPIGLEIQAETPEEIALSIMAEVVMTRNKTTGNPMILK